MDFGFTPDQCLKIIYWHIFFFNQKAAAYTSASTIAQQQQQQPDAVTLVALV